MHRRKFYNHTRLFVGGLPPNTTEDEVRDLFGRFGEILEVYVHDGKGFAKIRYASKDGPEKAIEELANRDFKGRPLRIRHAVPPGALTIKNIPDGVTNDTLERAFSDFGDAVERAVVYVDEKGVPTGEGVIEFSKKSTATHVMRKCEEGCYLIGRDPIPLTCEPFNFVDTEGGMSEAGNFRSRESSGITPHFADRYRDPIEHEWAMRWKKQIENEEMRRKDLESQIKRERDILMKDTRQAMRDSARRREDERRQEDERRFREREEEDRQRQYRERPGSYGPPNHRPPPQGYGAYYDQRDNYGPPPLQDNYGPPPPSTGYEGGDGYYGGGYNERPGPPPSGPPPPQQNYGGYGEYSYDQGKGGPDRGYGPPPGDRYAPYGNPRGPRGPPNPSGPGPNGHY